jgi:hypothetical protein
MTEEEANAVAEALRGKPWNSGGGIWLVVFHREDGTIAVMSDDVINVYEDQEAFDTGHAREYLLLH